MKISVSYLREIISEIITSSIHIRRQSLEDEYLSDYIKNIYDPPVDEEITDFAMSNQLYDEALMMQLSDPGLLGFHNNFGETSQEWLDEFISNTKSWASTSSWLAGDAPWWPFAQKIVADKVDLWTPENKIPTWVYSSPSYIYITQELIKNGKCISELHWRDFEKLIGHLLEKDGWTVDVTQASKDGGVDVIATKVDINIGLLKTVWQAKKYSGNNLVKLHEVRELYSVRDEQKASKGIIITTNRLSRDAI